MPPDVASILHLRSTPFDFASLIAFTRADTWSTTATVTSTAGSATLAVSDPGHLANGAFSLAQPLQVAMTPAAWNGPVSNATVAVSFRQPIGATDPLRTGTYTKTLTFTLSTSSP